MRSPCHTLLGRPLRTDTLLVKRRRAAYGGTRRWPRRMSHRPTGAAAAQEVLLFVGKARTSSSAPPFSRTSSRNASAGRSSPNGRPPSFTAALAQIGRHPSERPHATPARVAQIVARLSRRTDQIPVPCAAYTGQHRQTGSQRPRAPGHARPRPATGWWMATPGHVQPCPATVLTCLLSSRPQVRVLLGAQFRA